MKYSDSFVKYSDKFGPLFGVLCDILSNFHVYSIIKLRLGEQYVWIGSLLSVGSVHPEQVEKAQSGFVMFYTNSTLNWKRVICMFKLRNLNLK